MTDMQVAYPPVRFGLQDLDKDLACGAKISHLCFSQLDILLNQVYGQTRNAVCPHCCLAL